MLARNSGNRSLSSESTMLINYWVWLSPLPLRSHTPLWPWSSLHNNLYPPFPPANNHTGSLFLLPACRHALSLRLSQGYEDWLRHKADCSINECPVDVVQRGKVVRTQSHKLRVRMASLEQHSTWGHGASLQFCCIAQFFYNCLHSPLPLPLCSEASFLPDVVSLDFPTN